MHSGNSVFINICAGRPWLLECVHKGEYKSNTSKLLECTLKKNTYIQYFMKPIFKLPNSEHEKENKPVYESEIPPFACHAPYQIRGSRTAARHSSRAERGNNKKTPKQFLWDLLSNPNSATCRQGPGRELCQHPLPFALGHRSQNHSAPTGRPSAEAHRRPTHPPCEALGHAPSRSAGPLGGLCPCHGEGRRPAPAAHHRGLTGHSAARPARRLGRK